jgi:hypothetical protein
VSTFEKMLDPWSYLITGTRAVRQLSLYTSTRRYDDLSPRAVLY